VLPLEEVQDRLIRGPEAAVAVNSTGPVGATVMGRVARVVRLPPGLIASIW